MIKKYHTYIFICVFTSLNIIGMENPTAENLNYNPENTKFAFDFHGVVVTDPFFYYSDLTNAIGWNAIPALNQQLPNFLLETAKLMYYKPSGEGFRNICALHGQTSLVTCITEFANNIHIMPDTIHIIKELKQKGYDLDLASNVDMLFLQELETNTKYSHIQEILALFTNKKTIDCSNIHLIKPIKKPDPRYFYDYQDEHNTEKKQIIFVDDRLENVNASYEAGFIGIHFQNSKQLRQDLVTFGILESDKKMDS